MMKRLSLMALALAAPVVALGDTVFSDTFGSGSTINGTPTAPTVNSAAYQNWAQGANPANYSIASGALHFEARNTSSVFAEVQAQFASTPVTLTTAGDYINLTLVFTDTLNVLLSGQNASSQVDIGLYNSGGVLPLTGSRLDTTSAISGGTAGWTGYIGRLFLNGNANVITRPAQLGAMVNTNQDLLFNNAGSGAFKDPSATQIGVTTATGFTSGLTQGSQYTLNYKLTLTSATTMDITESLFDSGNNLLATQTATASGATLLTTSLDGLAFGWRRTATAAASSVDVNSILVTDYIQAVPEPSSTMLFCGGIGLLTLVRRFRR